MTLGERIRFFRKRAELTQEQLAAQLHLSEETVLHWEYNDSTPDLNQTMLLSKALGISVEELTEGVDLSATLSAPQAPADTPSQEKPPKQKKNHRVLWFGGAGVFAVVLVVILTLTDIIPLGSRAFSEDTEAIAIAENSVVMVYCYDDEENEVATGSGVVLFDESTIITNYHVIETAMQVKISTQQDFTYDISEILAYDIERDIAILKTAEPTGLAPLPLGDSTVVMKGETVTAIGSPLGIKNTVSTGVLSGRNYNGVFDELQFTAPISSGSSGGALFNEAGEVIGITYASFIEGQNLNLAIPSEVVQEVYDHRGESCTVEECLEDNHVGLFMLYSSEFVDYSHFLSNPALYAGKYISTIAYVYQIDYDYTAHMGSQSQNIKLSAEASPNLPEISDFNNWDVADWAAYSAAKAAVIGDGYLSSVKEGPDPTVGAKYLLCGQCSTTSNRLRIYYIEEIPQ